MSEELIQLKDAAKQLFLTPYTVRRYIKQGKIKAVKVGRGYLVAKSSIEIILENIN